MPGTRGGGEPDGPVEARKLILVRIRVDEVTAAVDTCDLEALRRDGRHELFDR